MAKKAAPKMNGPTFASAIVKTKTAWSKARKAKDTGGGFPNAEEIIEQLELGDGDGYTFEARLSSAQGKIDKNRNPLVSFNFVGIEGLADGLKLSRAHFLSEKTIKTGPNKGNVITVADVMSQLAVDLQRLGYETEELDPEDLEEILAELSKEKPGVQLYCKRSGQYVNVYINKLVDGVGEDDEEEEDEELEDEEVDDEETEEEETEEEEDDDGEIQSDETDDEEEDEEGAEDEDEDEGGEDDEEGEGEEEEDDEDEEEEGGDDGRIPVKGDDCAWKAPKAKKEADYTVTSVNKTKRHASLKRESDGKLFKAISWDEFELYEEADEE